MTYISEALEAGEEYGQAALAAYVLGQERHRLRRELGLPHDEHDDLADNLRDAVQDTVDDEPDSRDVGPAVLFWPKSEFDGLLLRWPMLAGGYGGTWDEHRARLQKALESLADSGHSGLALFAGSADGLAGYAARHSGNPADPDTRGGFAQHLTQHPRQTPWPPGRNDACWCGSPVKYKKCCLPRSRG